MAVYGNLIVAMEKAKVKNRDIARLLNLTDNSVSQKIHGKTEFRSSEMYLIKDTFFPNEDIGTLFIKR